MSDELQTQLEAEQSKLRVYLSEQADLLDDILSAGSATLPEDVLDRMSAERERLAAVVEELTPQRRKLDPVSKLRRLVSDLDDPDIFVGPDDRQAAILDLFDNATELGLAELWVVGELARGLRVSREELGPLLRTKKPVNR